MEYKGIGVSNGRSLGVAVVIHETEIVNTSTKEINKEEELRKALSAISSLIKEYDEIIEDKTKNKEVILLAEAYKMMVSSSSLYDEISDLIIKGNYNAVRAVDEVLTSKAYKMANLDNEYAKERSNDIKNIKTRIIKKILGINDINISDINYDFVLVGKEITPSMLLAADPNYIKGIVSELGGITSHVAILAKNIGIPVIFNIKEVDKKISDKEIIYIDGNKGIVVNEIDSDMIKKYQEDINNYKIISSGLNEMLDKKAKTLDGRVFDVACNAGDINDLNRITNIKSDGVGLFRSEFLYLNRNTAPSEDFQFNAYKALAVAMKDKPLIIRTIDIGGDKKTPIFDIEHEANPFLGYRAIRYCLEHKELFKTQLKAILRASSFGNVMIMYPMISSIDEVRNANTILREAMAELDDAEITYNSDTKVGIMVEVPSVAVMADLFIDEVDFFSIGTNDLIQYTLAVDRTNSKVSKLYDAYNPGVIRLVKKTIESKKDGKFVGMCGEMAADPLYIIILVGLGLDEFSVNVSSVLKVKKYISLLNYEECKKIVEHILTLKTGFKIKSYLENYAKEVFNIYLDL
jgi:phosphotransferase system enzyme I (PtsI)